MPPTNKEILVIDDTPENLKLLHSILSKSGYKTRSSPNGKLGILAAQTQPPDLILLDINMPGMNGFEVCRKLKEDALLKHIPIIFISALGESIDIVKALKAGGVDYITKPFEIEEVEARISTHLQVHDLQKRLESYNATLTELVQKKTIQLKEANERLITLENFKSEFMSMISHEIRTPLNGIFGIAELLLTDCDNQEIRKAYKNSSDRIKHLLEQTGLLGKLDLGESSKQVEGFSFNKLWDMALAKLASTSTIDCPHPALPSGQNDEVHCEPKLTSQAIAMTINIAECLAQELPIKIQHESTEYGYAVRFELPDLELNDQELETFFTLESHLRQSTKAEVLGISPIIASKIFSAYKGKLTFERSPSTDLVITLKRFEEER